MNRNWTSFGLTDQIAIVTGASQGIGRTLAIALAQAGADVALVSRTRSDLEAVAKKIEAIGRKALVIPADIQDVSQIRKLIDTVHTTFGKIDILINNAAWTATVEALEATEEEWDQTLDTSLKAVFFASQAVAEIMIQQGRGKIVNIGSTLGRTAFAHRSPTRWQKHSRLSSCRRSTASVKSSFTSTALRSRLRVSALVIAVAPEQGSAISAT